MRPRLLGSVLAAVFSAAVVLGAQSGSVLDAGQAQMAVQSDSGWNAVRVVVQGDSGWNAVRVDVQRDSGWNAVEAAAPADSGWNALPLDADA